MLSIYFPYRYRDHINTVLFSLTKSSNSLVNYLVRQPSKILIYGTSIFIGQFIARMYWVYKRSFNANIKATGKTYYLMKQCSHKPYEYSIIFEEKRPKMAT